MIDLGRVRVDLAGHQILRDSEPLPVKPKAFELLAFLIRNAGQVFSREQLLEQRLGLRLRRRDAHRGRPRPLAAQAHRGGRRQSALPADGARRRLRVSRPSGGAPELTVRKHGVYERHRRFADVLIADAATERPTQSERLIEHALLLHMWLDRPARVPARWLSATFARNVDLVRAHLRPIHTHAMLALSYGREHFHIVAVGPPPRAPQLISRDATEVAYAVRWLELDRGADLGAWRTIVVQSEAA